jgi:hypothetical protein
MRLARITEPFDHLDWRFELKSDGFRALAHVAWHRRQRIFGKRHIFQIAAGTAPEAADCDARQNRLAARFDKLIRPIPSVALEPHSHKRRAGGQPGAYRLASRIAASN